MPAMQTDMNQNNFVMLVEARSHLNVVQTEAFNEVQSHAIQSNKRDYLNHTAIKAHAESTLAASGFSTEI